LTRRSRVSTFAADRDTRPTPPTVAHRRSSRLFDRRIAVRCALAAGIAALAFAPRARAVMDTANHGPTLNVGRFAMRVTNVGVIGNAFFNNGLSFDPSFEFPRGSGHELLNHAELWVGALNERGDRRVSGGPLLEWRPTLDPADTVRVANSGDPGTRAHQDDDRDGQVDEERLNGRDDDGDGRVDEDFLVPAQQMLAADYTDFQREAINTAYPNGESHVPLGLAVHQRAYAWTLPGHDGIAGIEFTITNQGTQTLRDVYLGFYADLDSREASVSTSHLDDRVDVVPYQILFEPHPDTIGGNWIKQCGTPMNGAVAVVRDASPASRAAAVALMPLTHTTDPLAWLVNDAFPGVAAARAAARAPRKDSTFRVTPFLADAPPGQGGPPLLDGDRYATLAGEVPVHVIEPFRDVAVLVSCGPFKRLAPGQSLSFSVALVALSDPDSLETAILDTRVLHRGTRLDLQPNLQRASANEGRTGVAGHEICLEPPPGIEFNYDPHCPQKFVRDPDIHPIMPTLPPGTATESHYASGRCIWTDLDCDMCTGDDGVDEVRPWERDLRLPPSPRVRATPGDHQVLVEWDNTSELALLTGRVGGPGYRFAGYKLYRLDDWRRRTELPAPERWQRLAVYRVNPAEGGLPLADITDTSLPPIDADEGFPKYPVGRYRVTDTRALDGFDYHYVVTAIMREVPSPSAQVPPTEFESPFFALFEDRVVPHAAARPAAGDVWVVPNPYRQNAAWERQPVPGDPFTRHVDFMGLPRTRCTIRIYTLAGDLVQTIDHDASGGDGQAAWNLISRNGQDVESGVYLFTVSSDLGHQTGKFVLLR